MSQGIGLARVIQQVRAELEEAVKEGEGKDLRFTLQDLELELQVVVSEDASAKFGVGLKILELGIGDKKEESRAHTVKVKLQPHGPAGKPINLAGDRCRPS